jgi:hypothetical protein
VRQPARVPFLGPTASHPRHLQACCRGYLQRLAALRSARKFQAASGGPVLELGHP